MDATTIDAMVDRLRKDGYWLGKNPRADVAWTVYELDRQALTTPNNWNTYGRADLPMLDQTDKILFRTPGSGREPNFERDYFRYDLVRYYTADKATATDQTLLRALIDRTRSIADPSIKTISLRYLAKLIATAGSDEDRFRAVILYKEALSVAKAAKPSDAYSFARDIIDDAEESGLDSKTLKGLKAFADLQRLEKAQNEYMKKHDAPQ